LADDPKREIESRISEPSLRAKIEKLNQGDTQ
jgi:hypothetical protein